MASLATKRRILFWHPWHMEQTHKVYGVGRHIDWVTSPNGDHEWIESLVRFTHMLDLAAAYRLTGRRKYLQAFEDYLISFSEARARPAYHWKYRLNAAIRVINLIRAYDLIAHSSSLSDSMHLEVYENLLTDIRFLAAALGETVGNGEFFITTALLIAAEFLEEFFQVDDWRLPSERRLSEIIDSEVQPDGMEVEHAPMYHGQVVLTLMDYCVALEANGRPVTDTLKNTVTGMLDLLHQISDPQGFIPPIGDSDRFPIAYLDRFYDAVLGAKASQAVEQSTAATFAPEPSARCSLTTLETTGWAIARWDYDPETQGYLLFDCSGKPRPGCSWHSHADDLQFLLHTTSGPVFTDPGRFTYCSDFKAYLPFTRKRIYPKSRFRPIYSLLFPGFMALAGHNWRHYFQRTLSHNTISQDGEDQPGYSNHLEARYQVGLLRSLTIGPLVLLEGCLDTLSSTDSEKPLEKGQTLPGYQHRRTVVGYLPYLWIIIDQLKTDKEHNWISSYHLDIGGEVSTGHDHLEVTVGKVAHQLRFMAPASTDLSVAIERDWISRVYNWKQPAKTIRTTIHNESETELVTVIHTHADGAIRIDEASSARVVAATGDTTHEVYCLRLASSGSVTRLIINPERRASIFEGLEFNALVSVESRTDSQLQEAGFLGGSYLRGDGFELTDDSVEEGSFHKFQ